MKPAAHSPSSAVRPVGLWTAIRLATIAELSLVGAAGALLSVGGWLDAWLDVLAQWTPLWFLLSAAGGGLALIGVGRGRIRNQILMIAATGLIVSGGLMAPEFFRAAQDRFAAPAAGETLKVLTFNVWDENIDRKRTVDLALKTNADVIAIQENWGLGPAEFARLWAAYPFRSRKDAGCDAVIFSRRPLTASQTSVAMVDEHPTCFVWAKTTDSNGRPITLMTTHLAWPIPPGAQAIQRAMLAARTRDFDLRELILTGDFNLTPWSQGMRDQDAALRPLQRRTHAMFSWPANIAVIERPAPFPLLAIDHIYAGPAWRTLSVERLARGGSDHYGVLATLAHAAP